MTRTRPFTIVVIALAAAGLTWLFELTLVTRGAAIMLAPLTLGIALAAIAIIVVILAIPVRRAVRAREQSRIDPFYATRVVILAKSSSVAGALMLGVGGGMLVFVLTRAVIPGVGSIVASGATAGGAALLLAAGLIAESMCRIPPEDGDAADDGPAPSHPH